MIDVIVIAHDSEKNIENLLLNLVKQMDFINIILVDNGCSLKERKILQFYSKKYKMPLITNNNYNIKLAKTKALNITKNQYVFFVGGNDFVPANYFKSIFDENFTVIFGGNINKEYTFEDLLTENISSRIYGKLFDKKLLINNQQLTNSELFENFYKNYKNIKITSKNVPGYIHKDFEYHKKKYMSEYNKFMFFYNQYKYIKEPEYLKIIIEKMINYGNLAYIKMITDEKSYKVELNNIYTCYVSLKEDYNAKYDKKTFNKIKNGKFTKYDFKAKSFKISESISKTSNKLIDNIKPINKKEKKTKKKIKKKVRK